MKVQVIGLLVGLVAMLSLVNSPFARGVKDRDGAIRPAATPEVWIGPREFPDDPPPSKSGAVGVRATSPRGVWVRGPYVSIQVNVDANGDNVVGDAANEPSIAVDPTNPARMAIGWRQFYTILNNFRESGQGYSHDAGQTWTFPGVLEPGEFSSDPVLGADAEGRFYYYALQPNRGPGQWACYMYRSDDGGVTWPQEVYAWGGDKGWFTIDRTDSPGRGNIYAAWSPNAGCCGLNLFNRSTNGGQTFSYPVPIPESPRWGTLTVAPDGALYLAGTIGNGSSFAVVRSTNAQNPVATPAFDQVSIVNLGGSITYGDGPNPGGLLGQVWIAGDHSGGPTHGNLYVLASVNPPDSDPLDIMFVRSIDGGLTWSEPVRVNDDDNSYAWQWFGTMSVAPNGRVDAIWNDTRVDPFTQRSELYYSYSLDAGVTWSENVPLSPSYRHHDGYPSQNKLGDYYDMVSDNFGASIAYAATFNGEQDVYYLRIGDLDCNGNGIRDECDIDCGEPGCNIAGCGDSDDCNDNEVPDECEPDCNDNGIVDICDVYAGADDCDGNLNPDECDPDFDGDGDIDNCDWDRDGDGVPNHSDDCFFTPLGMLVSPDGGPLSDSSGNCVVDLPDYPRFVPCLNSGGPDVILARNCTVYYDYDGDSDVDLMDVAGFQHAFGRQ